MDVRTCLVEEHVPGEQRADEDREQAKETLSERAWGRPQKPLVRSFLGDPERADDCPSGAGRRSGVTENSGAGLLPTIASSPGVLARSGRPPVAGRSDASRVPNVLFRLRQGTF